MDKKILVLYHYFEKDHSYIENFFHFLAFGYAAALEYVIVIAGPYTISLPRLDNVRYLFTANHNNDFGGYTEALRTAVDVSAYDYFLFVNSSVRGPYTAAYSERCWAHHFIDKMAADDEVGLVGSTINILAPGAIEARMYAQKYGGAGPFAHVQTMCYALSQKALRDVCACGFFSPAPALGKNEVIRDYEIRLSQLLLARGWNIRSLCSEYDGIDFRLPCSDINPTSDNGDANSPYGYFGRTAHPLEVMFVKVNRGLFLTAYLHRLSYSAHKKRPPHPEFLRHGAFVAYLQMLETVACSPAKTDFTFRGKTILRLIPKFLRPAARQLFPSLTAAAAARTEQRP